MFIIYENDLLKFVKIIFSFKNVIYVYVEQNYQILFKLIKRS